MDSLKVIVCPACTSENGKHAIVCGVCHTPLPDLVDAQPKWSCNNCTYMNNVGDKECFLCNKPQYTSAAVKPALGSKMRSNGLVTGDERPDHQPPVVTPPRQLARQKSALSKTRRHEHKNVVYSLLEDIYNYCAGSQKNFEDIEFPAESSSLYGRMTNRDKETQAIMDEVTNWRRPHEVASHSRKDLYYNWSLLSDPSSNDIVQGLLGNCWFASALSVLAENPSLLHRVFITKEYSKDGVYAMRLCKDGEWTEVIVDDRLPCLSNGTLAFCKARRKQLWVPLLEKAMAKLHGGYAALVSGNCQEGLAILTGFPCESIEVGSLRTFKPETSHNKDLLWAKLLSSHESGFLMGCSCSTHSIPADILKDLGLVGQHAYSILDVQLVQGHRLMKLRNTWGTFSWLGAWSEHSDNWAQVPDDEKQRLGIKGRDEGLFWMSLDDWISYFSAAYVCYTREGWYETRTPGWFPSSIDTDLITMSRLYILETTEIDISLHQQSVRGAVGDDLVDILFVVFDDNWKLSMKSKRSMYNHVNNSTILHPGSYNIFCLSFTKWTNGPLKYTLATHSLQQVVLEQLAVPSDTLAQVLIQLAVTDGSQSVCDSQGTMLMYSLNKGWCGQISVAVNNNTTRFLHIKCDLSQSMNIVSTRGLVTIDSVPPRHRQVVNILTHLESSSSFSVRSRHLFSSSSQAVPLTMGCSSPNTPALSSQILPIHKPLLDVHDIV